MTQNPPHRFPQRHQFSRAFAGITNTGPGFLQKQTVAAASRPILRASVNKAPGSGHHHGTALKDGNATLNFSRAAPFGRANLGGVHTTGSPGFYLSFHGTAFIPEAQQDHV